MMLASALLLTLSAAAQTDPRWGLVPKGKGIAPVKEDMALGPAEDVFEWAVERALVNQRKRECGRRVILITGELELCLHENAALSNERDKEREGRIASEKAHGETKQQLIECASDHWEWGSFGIGAGVGVTVTLVGLVFLATQIN